MKKLKVLIGNPPWQRPGFYGVRAGSRWPHFERDDASYMPFPFVMGYAGAVLEREGFPVLVLDGVAERISEDAFAERVVGYRPDLIVLEVSTPSIRTDLEIVSRIHQELGGRARIALCGLHTPMEHPAFFEENPIVRYTLKGEYELTLLELCRVLEQGEEPEEVKGLTYRDGTDEARRNPPRPLLQDLDSLPYPARHHLPMYEYDDRPGDIPWPSLQMWASRGCPFVCNFCVWPQVMYEPHRYRVREPAAVAEEIQVLIAQYGFRSFYVDDDTFNIGKSRMLRFCEELQRRKVRVPWAAMARADTSDRETFLAMRRSGLAAIKFGVESAEQQIVEDCGKKLDLERVHDSVRTCKQIGVKVHLTFMFGLPGETYESAEKTIQMALKLDPDTLQFSIASPFPGTLLHQELERKGKIVSTDTDRLDGYNTSVICTDRLMAEDLELIEKEAWSRWNAHIADRGNGRKRFWKSLLRGRAR